jgi:hypothetical protein
MLRYFPIQIQPCVDVLAAPHVWQRRWSTNIWVDLANKLFVHVNSLTGNTECFFDSKDSGNGISSVRLLWSLQIEALAETPRPQLILYLT